MNETRQMAFHYEPLPLTRMLLRLCAEERSRMPLIPLEQDESLFKTANFAADHATDDELEQALHAYTERYGLTEITFADGHADSGKILGELLTQPRFEKYRRDAKRRGVDGYAVYDKKTDVLIPCEFGMHWQTMNDLFRTHDPVFYEDVKRVRHGLLPVDTTQEILDAEILARIEFIGGTYKPRASGSNLLGGDMLALQARAEDRREEQLRKNQTL